MSDVKIELECDTSGFLENLEEYLQNRRETEAMPVNRSSINLDGYGTHWKDCWKVHHECCVAMVEKLQRDKAALVERVDRLHWDTDERELQYNQQQERACKAEAEIQELRTTIDNLHDELAALREVNGLQLDCTHCDCALTDLGDDTGRTTCDLCYEQKRIAELENVLREVQYASVDGACVYCGETRRNGCKDGCIIAKTL